VTYANLDELIEAAESYLYLFKNNQWHWFHHNKKEFVLLTEDLIFEEENGNLDEQEDL